MALLNDTEVAEIAPKLVEVMDPAALLAVKYVYAVYPVAHNALLALSNV